MTTYRYKGMSAGGTEIEGVIEAFDQEEAILKAKESCRVLISVEPDRGGSVSDLANMDIGALLTGNKIKPATLALMCSQLAIELKAGMALVPALKLMAENEQDAKLKKMLESVAYDVHAGNGLAESFQKNGPGLPHTFIETLRAGEESGKLDECFTKLQKYYEDSANVSSKVGSALVYHIMLIVVAVAVVAIIMIKAVPVFESSFSSMGNELPWPTRALIAISHFLTDNILIIIAVIAALVLAIKLFGKTDTGAHLYAKLALVFPGIKLVNRMNAASQFSSTLSTMLSAGLPLLKATRITASVMDNLLISEDVDAAADGIVEGKKLGDGLKESQWLPSLLLEMTAVGEETGKIEDTLNVVNDYYNKEVSIAVDRALGILEPVIIIVLALMVVFILLSVYLPLFSSYGSI